MLLPAPLQAHDAQASLVERAHALAVLLREEFGVSFSFYDTTTGESVRVSEQHEPNHPATRVEVATVKRLAAEERVSVTSVASEGYQLMLPLYGAKGPVLIHDAGARFDVRGSSIEPRKLDASEIVRRLR